MKSRPNINVQAANIFLRAATYIRHYGWQIEGMGIDGGQRCSMGALDSAYPKVAWDKKLAAVMYRTLYEELDGLSLTQFNSRHKSGEKVARLFERTAARLRQGAAL
ncbi:MAG TPA: hypothetical protein VHC21_01055 [Candidatus Saccharimonadales bacterium]|nr:hypothetical protein [Candidatus Saccharimonadales bacterium]